MPGLQSIVVIHQQFKFWHFLKGSGLFYCAFDQKSGRRRDQKRNKASLTPLLMFHLENCCTTSPIQILKNKTRKKITGFTRLKTLPMNRKSINLPCTPMHASNPKEKQMTQNVLIIISCGTDNPNRSTRDSSWPPWPRNREKTLRCFFWMTGSTWPGKASQKP